MSLEILNRGRSESGSKNNVIDYFAYQSKLYSQMEGENAKKRRRTNEQLEDELAQQCPNNYRSPIATPMAGKSLTKAIIKLASKMAPHQQVMRGVKEVMKSIRHDAQGIIILAGDVSPVEIIAHIPIVCEDKSIPYVYIANRKKLGGATLSGNDTTVLMILKPSKKTEMKQFYEDFKEISKQIKEINPYI